MEYEIVTYKVTYKQFKSNNKIVRKNCIYKIKEYQSGDTIIIKKGRFIVDGKLCVIK